ncbi:hypothetical protein HED60_08375 [Planctomycetales bacterium ZRK34]|nr:hypothetical protein HED60_08375 [Planctomycetales bacterium ZRK34]
MQPHTLAIWNLIAAWAGLLAGMGAGAVVGIFFGSEDFAGGYGSWPRRLMRLGHISFFGLAVVNFMYYFTTVALPGPLSRYEGQLPGQLPGVLLIAGAILMPTVCYLSAWRAGVRHAFFLPVGCLITGVGLTLIHIIGVLS